MCGDLTKKTNEYWYTKLNFLGKAFYLMTRKDKAKSYNTLIYYCNLHNTTIYSNKIGINGNKLKIRKCNARLYYEKDKKEYYFETAHSKFCDNRKIQKYENIADINIEIKNYKTFRKDLIEYLDFNPIIKYSDFIKKANLI